MSLSDLSVSAWRGARGQAAEDSDPHFGPTPRPRSHCLRGRAFSAQYAKCNGRRVHFIFLGCLFLILILILILISDHFGPRRQRLRLRLRLSGEPKKVKCTHGRPFGFFCVEKPLAGGVVWPLVEISLARRILVCRHHSGGGRVLSAQTQAGGEAGFEHFALAKIPGRRPGQFPFPKTAAQLAAGAATALARAGRRRLEPALFRRPHLRQRIAGGDLGCVGFHAEQG